MEIFFGTNNDYIVKWNVKARKKDKRKIRSKRIAMKQGVLNDSWFKPILGKFNNEVSPYAYARRHVFHSTTLNNHKTIYEHEINSRINNWGKSIEEEGNNSTTITTMPINFDVDDVESFNHMYIWISMIKRKIESYQGNNIKGKSHSVPRERLGWLWSFLGDKFTKGANTKKQNKKDGLFFSQLWNRNY